MATNVLRFRKQDGPENLMASFLVSRKRLFEVFVTVDTNLRYQQNLAGRRIAIVVMVAGSNRLVQLSRLFPACLEALKTVKPGEIVQVE